MCKIPKYPNLKIDEKESKNKMKIICKTLIPLLFL